MQLHSPDPFSLFALGGAGCETRCEWSRGMCIMLFIAHKTDCVLIGYDQGVGDSNRLGPQWEILIHIAGNIGGL